MTLPILTPLIALPVAGALVLLFIGGSDEGRAGQIGRAHV